MQHYDYLYWVRREDLAVETGRLLLSPVARLLFAREEGDPASDAPARASSLRRRLRPVVPPCPQLVHCPFAASPFCPCPGLVHLLGRTCPFGPRSPDRLLDLDPSARSSRWSRARSDRRAGRTLLQLSYSSDDASSSPSKPPGSCLSTRLPDDERQVEGKEKRL
jgi:hypothetical protein